MSAQGQNSRGVSLEQIPLDTRFSTNSQTIKYLLHQPVTDTGLHTREQRGDATFHATRSKRASNVTCIYGSFLHRTSPPVKGVREYHDTRAIKFPRQ